MGVGIFTRSSFVPRLILRNHEAHCELAHHPIMTGPGLCGQVQAVNMCSARCLGFSSAIAGVAFVVICLIASGRCDQPAWAAKAQSANSQQAALIHQGKLIFDETPKYASSYVGNKLACSDCHLQSGTAPYASPMIDLSGLFPMFSKRAGHVISIQNRIQDVSPVVRPDVRCLRTAEKCWRSWHISIGSRGMG